MFTPFSCYYEIVFLVHYVLTITMNSFRPVFLRRQQDDIYIMLEWKQINIRLDACIQADI